MIRFIVDRLHVGTSCTGIVREFYRRYKESIASGRQGVYLHKSERKDIYRRALKYHRENRELCAQFKL